jgi:hypothetical protein
MIKVVMTNGAEFMTRSTYGEEGATLLSRFNSRFGELGARGKKK